MTLRLSSIVFEKDDFDIVPRANEHFVYEEGSQWIKHYEKEELIAMYNINFIREITIQQKPKTVTLPIVIKQVSICEDTLPPIIEYPAPPKACEICICEDVPNEQCPVHRKYE